MEVAGSIRLLMFSSPVHFGSMQEAQTSCTKLRGRNANDLVRSRTATERTVISQSAQQHSRGILGNRILLFRETNQLFSINEIQNNNSNRTSTSDNIWNRKKFKLFIVLISVWARTIDWHPFIGCLSSRCATQTKVQEEWDRYGSDC